MMWNPRDKEDESIYGDPNIEIDMLIQDTINEREFEAEDTK